MRTQPFAFLSLGIDQLLLPQHVFSNESHHCCIYLLHCPWLLKMHLSVLTATALLLMLGSSSKRATASNSEPGLRSSIEQNVTKREIQSATRNLEGSFETEEMLCAYPIKTDLKSPLLSFARGPGNGGVFITVYQTFMIAMASAGFVICAPVHCAMDCLSVMHLHQLNAFTAAKEHADRGNLPVRREGGVGLIGYSSGGVSTLMCCYSEYVSNYSIGLAMTYDSTGAAYANENMDANLNLETIDSSLRLFMTAADGLLSETIWDHTIKNAETLLSTNPNQPLLVASIDGVCHSDPASDSTSNPVHAAPLVAVSYVIAFFTNILKCPELSEGCCEESKRLLEEQLRSVSPTYYYNNLFRVSPSSETPATTSEDGCISGSLVAATAVVALAAITMCEVW